MLLQISVEHRCGRSLLRGRRSLLVQPERLRHLTEHLVLPLDCLLRGLPLVVGDQSIRLQPVIDTNDISLTVN